MSVVYVTGAAAHPDLATSVAAFSVGIPTAARVAGNLAIVSAGMNSGSATAPTPAGWTLLQGPIYTSTVHVTYLWAKILDGTETIFTTTFTVAAKLHGAIVVLSGAKMPVASRAVNINDSTTGTTVAAASVTTVSADNVLVAMALIRGTTAVAKMSSTVSSGWQERLDNGTASTTAPNFIAPVATKAAPTIGAQTGPTWTPSDTLSTGQAYTIAVEPDLGSLQGLEGWINFNGVMTKISGGKINWNGVMI